MKKHFQRAAFLALFAALPLGAVAQPASSEDIKALMQSTGAGELGKQMMTQMIPALKNMIPDAPDSFWQDVISEVNADEIEDMIIPVYQKHLTASDIKTINQFYQTDAGKKLIKAQPAIMQESMLIGQQWGQGLAKKVLEKYQQQQAN